jgi:hypothetical protein
MTMGMAVHAVPPRLPPLPRRNSLFTRKATALLILVAYHSTLFLLGCGNLN